MSSYRGFTGSGTRGLKSNFGPKATPKWKRWLNKAGVILGYIGIGVLFTLAVIALVTVLNLFTGLLFYLGWKLGAVKLIAACGGKAAVIGYWASVFTCIFISIIGGLLVANKNYQYKPSTS